jgi:uncharacterized SAM-binding protein YcdF (DUF218 family)
MTYIFSKLVTLIAAPVNLFCLLLLLGGFAAISHDERWQRSGRRLCFVLALLLFFISVLPVGQWLMMPLENCFPPQKLDHVDGVILLAGDEDPFLTQARHQPALGDTALRYITFAALAKEYPKARLVFTGGNNSLLPRSALSNGDVARMALKDVGVSLERMTYEDASRNTYENAVFSHALVKPQAGQKWLLVTSAIHMPRALMTFRKAGWPVFPAPTDYYTAPSAPKLIEFNPLFHLREMNLAFHEYVGLLEYRVLGRTDKLWP